MKKPKLTVLSWGLGLQSTALLEMSARGYLPKLDVAIFADTGFEQDYSHDIYNFYAPRAIKSGIRVIKISDQDIFRDNFEKVSLPLFVMGTDRQIKRKCTRDYKIRPIQRRIRDLLGVNRRGRLAADLVDLWLGITVDEIHRAKDSRVAFINHKFPLLDLNYFRDDCTQWFKGNNLPIPKKSSCKFCPYQKKCEWSEKSPDDLALIAYLQNHINKNGLVKINGQDKELSFLPYTNLQADFFDGCDGGFCNL